MKPGVQLGNQSKEPLKLWLTRKFRVSSSYQGLRIGYAVSNQWKKVSLASFCSRLLCFLAHWVGDAVESAYTERGS